MAIVSMKKFTLLTFESKRATLLEKLQDFADVEFINLQNDEIIEGNEELKELAKDNSDSAYVKCEDKLSMAKFALQFLQSYVPRKSILKEYTEGKRDFTITELEEFVNKANWVEICNKVKEKENQINKIESEQGKMESEIESLEPLKDLDVSFKDIKSIKTPCFIGSVPSQYEEELASELKDIHLEIISKDNHDVYFLALCGNDDEEEVLEKLRAFGFNQFKTNSNEKPIDTIIRNKDSIEKLNSEIFFIEEELKILDEDVKTLELVCEYYENILIRKEAISNFLKTESVVLLQGWVPEEAKEKLNNLMKSVLDNDFHIEFEDVLDDETDKVPVKLKNNALNSCFQSVTEMYSTPRYDEIDPTPLLTPFYLLFFGMMVADTGYGIVQLIITALALKFLKFDEGTKKFVKFFFYLSFPIIAWGLIYGSFFGFDIPGKLFIRPTQNINTILLTSVAFGVVQIFIALGIKAYMLIKANKLKDAFYDVGVWYLALIGIALFLGGGSIGLSKFLTKVGMIIMILSMITIVLTAGRSEKTKGAQLGQGIYELYGITGYISDLVSYTRLMAMGLAGGSLASAMNLMMGMVPGVAGLLFGPVIFIFGHIFNIALSLLGAYVHTCRLQYVEYFGKFYEGGGKAFTPFKTKNNYINIKKEKIN